MDPLTSLSIAGTIVQFVDFSFKIIKGSRELYERSQLDTNAQVGDLARRLESYSEELQKYLDEGLKTPESNNELALRKISLECISVAKDILEKLKALRVSGKHRVWDSVQKALRNTWKQDEIAALERKLTACRDEMDSRLLAYIAKRTDQITQSISEVMDKHQQALSAHLEGLLKETVANVLLEQRLSFDQGMKKLTEAIGDLTSSGPVTRSPRNKLNEEFEVLLQAFKETKEGRTIRAGISLEEAIAESETRLREQTTNELISSLKFDTITDRFETVSEVHPRTFDWIFHEPDSSKEEPWDNFVEWLRNEHKLYWINGKAGSGKSTLMKYLYCHPSTKNHLQFWAQDKEKLHISGFFFWATGTKLQKSKLGLLRSLLYDSLRHHPDAVAHVLPTQWANRYNWNLGSSKTTPNESWSTAGLLRALEKYLSHISSSTKTCWFIDGLDEYEGQDIEIADFFTKVVRSTELKVCMSSRPHVIFENLFKSILKLRLHDLTKADIELYVYDLLDKNDMMVDLKRTDPPGYSKLLEDTINRSNGVFLWVRLVIESLLDGLGHEDDIETMQARLDELPVDLEELYKHMLSKVSRVYKDEPAQIFQLVSRAGSDMHNRDDFQPLMLLTLSLALNDNTEDITRLRDEEQAVEAIKARCLEMDTRLRTRTGGLVETSSNDHNRHIWERKVTYLHHTVREYIETEEVSEMLAKRSKKRDKGAYQHSETILQGCTAHLKLMKIVPFGNEKDYMNLEYQGYSHARRCESEPLRWRIQLFDEFFSALGLSNLAILKRVAGVGLHCYMRYLLENNDLSKDEKAAILSSTVSFRTDTSELTLKVISLLLKHGAEPNRSVGSRTAWECIIHQLKNSYFPWVLHNSLGPNPKQYKPIVRVLLDAGTDPEYESTFVAGIMSSNDQSDIMPVQYLDAQNISSPNSKPIMLRGSFDVVGGGIPLIMKAESQLGQTKSKRRRNCDECFCQ